MWDAIQGIRVLEKFAGSRAPPATARHISIDAMRNLIPQLALGALLLTASCSQKTQAPTDKTTIRCAVIGGMTMTGLWPEIQKRFEAQTDYRLELVATGPRPELDKVMREGKVDL